MSRGLRRVGEYVVGFLLLALVAAVVYAFAASDTRTGCGPGDPSRGGSAVECDSAPVADDPPDGWVRERDTDPSRGGP